MTTENASTHSKYNDVIRRIHNTLVVAPTLASLVRDINVWL